MSYLVLFCAICILAIISSLIWPPIGKEDTRAFFVFWFCVILGAVGGKAVYEESHIAHIQRLERRIKGPCHNQIVCESVPARTWVESEAGQIMQDVRLCHCKVSQ